MSFSVRSGHLVALHNGRMVGTGDRVDDSTAKKNPRLVQRGVLVKDETRKSGTKKPEQQDGHEPAASPQKEDDK